MKSYSPNSHPMKVVKIPVRTRCNKCKARLEKNDKCMRERKNNKYLTLCFDCFYDRHHLKDQERIKHEQLMNKLNKMVNA